MESYAPTSKAIHEDPKWGRDSASTLATKVWGFRLKSENANFSIYFGQVFNNGRPNKETLGHV